MPDYFSIGTAGVELLLDSKGVLKGHTVLVNGEPGTPSRCHET